MRNIHKGVEILPKLKKVRYKVPEADKSERRKKSQAHIRAVEQAGVSAAIRYFLSSGYQLKKIVSLKASDTTLFLQIRNKECTWR